MNVFVYGDSISMQYGFPLEELLNQEGVKYDRLGNRNSHDLSSPIFNGLSTKEMLIWIRKTEVKKETVLVFNCGLHDIVRNDINSECQVPLEEYKTNMEKIVANARVKFAEIVFCNSTPVDDARHNRGISNRFRFNDDLIRYNNIADSVMEKEKIPIVDLYSLTTRKREEYDVYIDHVHMKEKVSELHAEKIFKELIKNGFING